MKNKKIKKLESKEVSSSLRKYMFWIVILLLLISSIWIIKPFIISLISAFILAYLIKPVYNRLSKRIGKNLSAIISIFMIIFVFLVPLILISSSLISQINDSESFDANLFVEKVSKLSFLEKYNLNDLKTKALSFLLSQITSLISFIPYLIISTLVTLLGIYYTLINWDRLSLYLEGMLPFEDKKRIRNEISKITNGIVFGYLLIALIELAIGIIGFYISGVSSFLLLASLIALFAFIPALGPGIVWVPTVFYYAVNGNYYTAIGVLITGIIISVFVENFIFIKLVGKQSKIQPLVFLLGVLGGVSVFGIFGFIIGPLILVYSIKLIQEGLRIN